MPGQCASPRPDGTAPRHAPLPRPQPELRALLHHDPGTEMALSHDDYGHAWITCRQPAVDLTALVTRLHGITLTLTEAGFGGSLLSTTVGFAVADTDRTLGLVALLRRGTVYPFAPRGAPLRDISLELRVRSEVSGDLPIEPDLERWFPTWHAPVP